MALINRILQQRHAYYRGLLAVEVLALLGLRWLEQAPRLVSVVYLLIPGMAVVLASPLLPGNRLRPSTKETFTSKQLHRIERALVRRKLIVMLWLLALLIEISWQGILAIDPIYINHFSALHLLIWLPMMLYQLWGLVTALAEEPSFSGNLLMGAAAGYLLVGFTGGVLLDSLLVIDPSAFNLPANSSGLPAGIGQAPAMVGAAFASLTTIGSPLLKMSNLTCLTASVAITIVGQLYVAILIAGVLGKPRRATDAARRAEHPGGQRAVALRKIGTSRR